MGEESSQRDIRERTFEFAVRVVKLCQNLDSVPGVSRTLANQLLRSATSVGANVEEAQAGQSKADFESKLNISLKEAREAHYWLRLLTAAEIIPNKKLAPLTQEANELIAILTTILKNSRKK